MCELTPKISCSTTRPPRGRPLGAATYAGNTKPSAAFRSINCPMSVHLRSFEDDEGSNPRAGTASDASALSGAQPALDEIEPVLAPEHLAVDDVAGRAEHAGLERLACVRVELLVRGLAGRLLQPIRCQALLGKQLEQRLLVRDVALLGPDRGQRGAGDAQRRVGAVMLVDRDDQPRRIVA